MEWKIIHFLHDNVVEAVPSAWVFDDICYWPPFKGSKLTQAISSCVSPIFGEWNICKIRQLANRKIYAGVKSSQSTVTNKYHLDSITVRKHHEKENYELPTTSTYKKPSSETDNNLSDNNFKKQVLRQLQIINLRQQQISEDISVLLMKANSEKNEPIISNEDSIFKTYNFPLKEIEELEALEEFLIEDNNFKNFVTEIMQIGGISYKHMVKRVLTRIISNDLSKTYSWIGFKGKHNFSNLRTCSAILIATQKTHGCSEAMIEAIIKYWLVKSTERQKQSTKEKKS